MTTPPDRLARFRAFTNGAPGGASVDGAELRAELLKNGLLCCNDGMLWRLPLPVAVPLDAAAIASAAREILKVHKPDVMMLAQCDKRVAAAVRVMVAADHKRRKDPSDAGSAKLSSFCSVLRRHDGTAV